MLFLAQTATDPLSAWTTVGGTGALIALFWLVVRALRSDCLAKDLVITKKDDLILDLHKQYREDGLRNLEVLKDVADLVNTLSASQTGTQTEIREGFTRLTTHISEAVARIEKRVTA